MPTDYFPVGPIILTLIVRELGEEECNMSLFENVRDVQAQYEASKV